MPPEKSPSNSLDKPLGFIKSHGVFDVLKEVLKDMSVSVCVYIYVFFSTSHSTWCIRRADTHILSLNAVGRRKAAWQVSFHQGGKLRLRLREVN